QLWGAVAGSAVLTYAGAELGRDVAYWRGLLGVFIMLIMVAAPSGLLGLLSRLRRRVPHLAGGVR
ncbi:MAG: ABC transporter permease, partial [Polaromonas sp.]